MRILPPLMLSLVTACSLYSSDDADPPPPPPPRASQVFPAEFSRDLDILFVIDNSGSMAEEQTALASNFPELANVLESVLGGLPNVHVGVVSTNVGTGGVNVPGCSTAARPQGDDGQLLTNDCAGLSAPYLSDVLQPDGSRERNYTGDLSANFACMARLGTSGCGFEQPLEAMRRALDPARNPGFIRPGARLAVVFIGDEDDCSAVAGGALFGDPSADITSVLGPRTSFRCFEHGVECTGDTEPRTFGSKTGCVPRNDSAFVQAVDPYISFLWTLKPRPADVMVAGIFGNVDSARTAVVVPDPDDSTRPRLDPSCASNAGVAFPGFRLRAFLEGFPGRNFMTSICNDNLAPVMSAVASEMRHTLGVPCMGLPLADVDGTTPGLQADCQVTEFTEVGGSRTGVVTIPACTGALTTNCWRLASDAATCPDTADNLALLIDRGGNPPPAGTTVETSCVVH